MLGRVSILDDVIGGGEGCSTKSVAALAGFEAEPEKKEVVRDAKEEEGEEVEEYSWWARSGPKGWT